MNVVVLATSWGTRFGGVNSFSMDLTLGFASYVGTRGCVVCCVPTATDTEIAAAGALGVVLLSLNRGKFEGFDVAWIPELLSHPSMSVTCDRIQLWVGHDLFSGHAAIAGARTCPSSKSALIMHMNYEAYKGFQKGRAEEAQNRFLWQQSMFREGDFLFGNGPLLTKALQNMTGRPANMLVPGLHPVPAATSRDEVHAITFGRMDRENDSIKQGSLAVAAFASAMKSLQEGTSSKLKGWPKKLKVFGIADDFEEKALTDLAWNRCGSSATILPLRYEDDRAVVFDELSRANVALVPSWHEGFGMTGWEAIASETPLILSRNTGLWSLLSNEWNEGIAKGLVGLVEIDGRRVHEDGQAFSDADENNVANAIVATVVNLEDRIRHAEELKSMLQDRFGCTWERTAEDLLEATGLVPAKAAEEEAFSGEWTSFFVEGSVLRDPVIVKEDVSIQWNKRKRKLEGKSTYKVREQGREEFFFEMTARRGVLAGTTSTKNWRPTDGWARFQVAFQSGRNLLDGVVSWSSSLKTDVDWSRYIWVRKTPNNERLIAFAQEEMTVELTVLSDRLGRQVARVRNLPEGQSNGANAG